MECSVCGAKIHEGDKFCTSCGSPVDQMNPASESNAQVNAGGGVRCTVQSACHTVCPDGRTV